MVLRGGILSRLSNFENHNFKSTLYVINTLTPHFPPDESYGVESTSCTTQNTGPKRNVPKQAINSESNFRPSSASPIPCSSVQSISTFRLLACLDKLENMAIEMGLKLARIYPKNSIDNSTVLDSLIYSPQS